MHRPLLPLLLAICAMAVACSSEPTDDPEQIESGRLIVWDAERIGVLDGDEVVEIEVAGAVSQVTGSDGGTLVWTSVESDPPSVSAVISEGDQTTIATPTIPFFYEWDPTGRRIAFLGNAPSGAGLLFGLIDVESGELISIESPPPFFFDWSPDGEQLIAHVGAQSLRLIDAESGAFERLPEASGLFPAPAWTDRGIVVVVQVGPTVGAGITPIGLQESVSEVVLLDPDGDTSVTLAEVQGPVRLFPGAESLALVGGAAGDQRIEVIGWDGAQRATLGDGTIDVAQWSPDGSTLLWTERGTEIALTPKTWSAGETSTYDTFRPTAVFATAYVPFWDQYDRTLSLWSLDSSSFALPTDEGIAIHSTTGESSVQAGWDMAAWVSAQAGD